MIPYTSKTESMTKPSDLKISDSSKLDAEQEMLSCLQNLDTEEQSIREYIEIRVFKKGEHLIREGEIAQNSYSVFKGCVRQYYLVDGEEKTTFFYTEGQSIFSLQGEARNKPAKHNLSCVEDSTLSLISRENEMAMYKRFPRLESMSRLSLRDELVSYQEMLASYITTSPEERYANMLENRPELLNRVPQYMLASYLGVKPESLSRIRKRISLR